MKKNLTKKERKALRAAALSEMDQLEAMALDKFSVKDIDDVRWAIDAVASADKKADAISKVVGPDRVDINIRRMMLLAAFAKLGVARLMLLMGDRNAELTEIQEGLSKKNRSQNRRRTDKRSNDSEDPKEDLQDF